MNTNQSPRLPSERSFGIVFTAVFYLSAAYFTFRIRNMAIALPLFLIGCGFLIATLVKPGILAPLNRIWFKFGVILNKITSPVILGAIFFLVFTPIAVLMRVFRRDALKLRQESDSASYWIDRDPVSMDLASFKNQF